MAHSPTPRRVRALLFDKDGTLIDFRATWLPAYEAAVMDIAGGDPARADELLTAGGYHRKTGAIDPRSLLAAGTNVEIAALWAGMAGIADAAALAASLDRRFQAHARAGIAPVGDLKALFARLRRNGYALGVATNDSESALKAQITALGIAGATDFLAGFDSGHGAKPGPGMVQAFGKALGVRPAEIAVIGDSLHDLEMGRRAGAGLLVGVLTGASDRRTLAAMAHHVLENVMEIERVL